MPRSVEVDRSLSPVRIRAEVLHELCQHAVQEAPDECCGLIVGNALERHLRPVRCRNEMTVLHLEDPHKYPRNGASAFYMSDGDVLRVSRAAEEAGERITAVYHSHVGAGAYLSDLDLAYATHPLFPFPDADQIVVPVVEGTARGLGLFRRRGDDFAGHRIEPAG